ncbi:uncharacterized protein LOC135394166 [Ornithodoros turicata]|uniref:uncharacterized protein LOC135394166 n=1 Tax=Ornithodoros turicata TaxID=34597 RepID=UPI003139FA62
MERQKPPYVQPCQEDWPEDYKVYVDKNAKYSSTVCKEICVEIHIWKACSCQPINSFIVRRPGLGVPRQTCQEELDDVDECVENVRTMVCSNGRSCPCLRMCREKHYVKKTSIVPWFRYIYNLSNGGIGSAIPVAQNNKVLAEVAVYPASGKVLQRRKSPKIKTTELVSSIGGVMGMYIGFSFLVIFNIADVVARAVIVAVQKRYRSA